MPHMRPSMLRSALALAPLLLPLSSSCASNQKELSREDQIQMKLELARGHFNLGEMERAQAQAEEGLKLDEDNIDLRLTLGRILQHRANRGTISRAEQVFRDLSKDAKDDWRVPLGPMERPQWRGAFRDPDSSLATFLLHRTKYDPFLLKEVREPSIHPGWLHAATYAVFFLYLLVASNAEDQALFALLPLTGIMLLVLFPIIAIGSSRLLPTTRRGKPLDLLHSTPLRGTDLVRSSVALLVLRCGAIFAVVGAWLLFGGAIAEKLPLIIALIAHGAAWLLLVGALSLGATLVGRGASQRVGGALLATLLLGSGVIPGFPLFAIYLDPEGIWLRAAHSPGGADGGFLSALVSALIHSKTPWILTLALLIYAAVPFIFERRSGRVRQRSEWPSSGRPEVAGPRES